MNCTRARGRYLTALGLTGLHTAFAAFGCRGAEPATTSAPPLTAASATPAETLAPAAPHTGPWVPSTASDPPVQSRPGIGVCPHGPFCVPQPADPGSAPAPAPLQACADTVPLPTGIGPTETVGGRQPGVSFDAARTVAERATDPAACCYQWHVLCVGGRALRGQEGPIAAPPVPREDWLAPEGAVDATALGPAAREALAAHWEREAAFEHASVGAFAQASLALLAVGAPPDLVAATHAAALDEIEHARLAYALAFAYGGARRGPGPMPVTGGLGGDGSLASVALDTFLDGCAGEATAALALREAAATADQGPVRVILERIAEDEERHAELAWRTVAWALQAGGEAVARRLIEGTAMLRGELHGGAAEPAPGLDLSAHGVLGEAAQQAIRRRAIAEVVIPCAEALLAAARVTAPGSPAARTGCAR